jgi:molybdate transport system ATP-binding protein
MIELAIRKRLGSFELAVERSSSALALGLLGPSGSGKTTLLHCIAGVLPLDRGRIALDGQTLSDTTANLHVPPPRRGLGLMFQDALVFPHLSVAKNLTYGLAAHGAGPALDEVVDVLELGDLLPRSPATLSGGQARRVSLARALLSGPKWLLLDEPLTGLDRAMALRTLHYLRRVSQQFRVPFIYVSHTAADILHLCDEAWAIRDGRVIAAGCPRTIVLHPDRGGGEAAELATVVVARRDAGPPSAACYRVGGLTLWCVPDDVPPGQEALVTVRSEDVILACEKPARISARNVIAGRIAERSVTEHEALVSVHVDAASPDWLVRLTPAAVRDLGLEPGSRVYAVVKATSLRAVPL